MAKLRKRLGFNLADAFARNAEFASDFLERARTSALKKVSAELLDRASFETMTDARSMPVLDMTAGIASAISRRTRTLTLSRRSTDMASDQ